VEERERAAVPLECRIQALYGGRRQLLRRPASDCTGESKQEISGFQRLVHRIQASATSDSKLFTVIADHTGSQFPSIQQARNIQNARHHHMTDNTVHQLNIVLSSNKTHSPPPHT
jgi:hypothetical protein